MGQQTFLITVKILTPEGWKPRTKTIKCLGIGDVTNSKKVLEGKALNLIYEAYKKQYPNMELKYSVSSVRYNSEVSVFAWKDKKDDEEHEEV